MAHRRVASGRNRTLRVALAQIEPVLGDLEANVTLHLSWARRALAAGARLLVFPELSLTGYLLQDLVSEVAIPLADEGLMRPLLDMSRRIAMVVGLVEETSGHRYHNSAVFLEGGRAVHVHRKVYLPTYGMFDEGRYFAAGDRLVAFDTSLGRVGLLICEDFWHPSTALILAQDGADYLLVISAGPTEAVDSRRGLTSRSTWRDLAKVTAQMQTVYVAYANRVGFEDGIHFGGGSCLYDPFGEALAEGGCLDEALIVCDLDRSALRRARTMVPLLRDERLPVLAREVQRLLAVPATGRARRSA